MELEINRLKFIINQMSKKGSVGYKLEHNQCCSSSSTSESGSGGSKPLKVKKHLSTVKKPSHTSRKCPNAFKK